MKIVHGAVTSDPRAIQLDRLWVSRCGHVALDAIAAAAFAAAGSCPRGCAVGAPITWTEIAHPFFKPMPTAVSDLFGAFGSARQFAHSFVAGFQANLKRDECLRSIAVDLFGAEPTLLADSSVLICSHPPCLKAALLKCGRCDTAYCSPACQRAHWRCHKRACASAPDSFIDTVPASASAHTAELS